MLSQARQKPPFPIIRFSRSRLSLFDVSECLLDAESNGFSLVEEIHPSRLWIYRNAADGGL
jgi:hypothetical protein